MKNDCMVVDTWPSLANTRLCVEIFRLDKVGHVLGLRWRGAVVIVTVTVVVRVRVVRRANVVHLVGRTALHASGLGLFAGELDEISDAIGKTEMIIR